MEKIYRTPEKHLYPLHLVRPRFKNNLEDVLFYMAKEINDFNGPIDNESLNDIISKFPGNSHISTKTLSNWRTEISTLFGLMQYNDNYGYYPSNITKRLSEKEDLIEFFKNFSIKLQFPSGILKSHVNKELIERNINFLPFKFTIELLYILKSQNKNSAYITKDELTYIVFDDIRFTTNKLKPSDASKIILHNRELNYSYEKHPYTKGYTKESKGDQTRTSFDFLDYMQYGNLLIKKGDKYYLNEIEEKFIQYAYKKTDTFTFFDRFYNSDINIKDIHTAKHKWFDYVNDLDFEKSKTSINKFIESNSKDENIIINIDSTTKDQITTKDIGDMGESLIIAHEKNKLKRLGLEHNIHLVKFIPTHLGAGYDIKSMDEMDNHIFIEVKTTLSNHPLTQSRISLTKNEWNAAYTHGDNYYIYRLIIDNESKKLFIINNPVDQIKNNKIKLSAPKGVELIFKPDEFKTTDLLL